MLLKVGLHDGTFPLRREHPIDLCEFYVRNHRCFIDFRPDGPCEFHLGDFGPVEGL